MSALNKPAADLVVVPTAYRSTPEAWRAGYLLERDALPPFPGPERSAYQAGWVAGKRAGYLAHKANVDGSHDELPTGLECPGCGHGQ
jgi:hypothetical protein